MYITPYYRNNISNVFSQIDRLFEDAFSDNAQPAYAPVNLYEQDDRYIASMDAPGFSKDAFEIEFDHSVVKVKAEAKSEGDNTSSARRSISRAFRVPQAVDGAVISARYENGILALDLPKKAASVSQKIEVK